MKIPFTDYDIKLAKRGITGVGRNTGLPVDFDIWVNAFSRISNRTPILEGIYDTIATEFSKIDLILSREEIVKIDTNADDGKVDKKIYTRLTDNPNYHVLALRPNMLQTKSELLYTIAYQMHMYRNALIRIVREPDIGRNVVTALEPINCEDYLFGQGYQIGEHIFLKLKEIKSGRIVLYDYNDMIHLRLNPNDIFYGDKNDRYDLTNFINIFDENLNVMLNELKDAGTIRGIIEVGGGLSEGSFVSTFATGENKITKQEEIVERIKKSKGGILVLDSGEKWHPVTRNVKTMTTDEINNIMKYLYNFKGINQAVIDGTATQAQMEVFFYKTIMPIVEKLIEELNYKILTQTARTQGQRIEYFKNPFEYISTKDIFSGTYLSGMYLTQNEVRRLAWKLPAIEGGDVLMDNKNFSKPGQDTEKERMNENEGGD